MRLEGKVALITGAATGVEGELMGFGGASARLFAQEGAKVVLSDINEEGGLKTAEQIRDTGGDAIFVRLDVTQEQDWIDAIQTTVTHFGRLNILVNNAGTSARLTVEETTSEIWDGQMALHARGVFLGTKHAIPEMRRAGGARSSTFRQSTAWSAVRPTPPTMPPRGPCASSPSRPPFSTPGITSGLTRCTLDIC
jgi:NAD(P)-dependent dehydrogenase (short-subunit alcohol dehydrogenase family)